MPPPSDSQDTHLDEERWIYALKRREAWAWTRLQHRLLDPVFGYVFLRCGRREDAEDVTAEVFAAAVAGIDQFQGGSRVFTWLIGIARRKLADAYRRRDRRPEVLETDLYSAVLGSGGEDTPHAALERRETVAQVRGLVLQLPEAQREAILLHCVDQLSLAETALVLGRSEDAVKGLLRRARLTLQERLAEGETPLRPIQEKTHVEATLSSVVSTSPSAAGK